MLTAIRIGNFKAFAGPQRVPLRPLTLIFGANSSGKSSILHSLVFAHHAQETGELDISLTKIGGTGVDLGGFKQFIHQRNTGLRAHFDWEILNQGFNKRLRENLLPGVRKAVLGLSVGLSSDESSIIKDWGEFTPRQILMSFLENAKQEGDETEIKKLESQLADSETKLTLEEIIALRKEIRVESCWLDLDDRRFLSLSSRAGGILRLDMLDQQHEAAKYLLENLVLAYSTADHIKPEEIDLLGEAIDEVVPSISFKIGKLFPQEIVDKDLTGSSTKGLSLVTVRKESRLEDLRNVIKQHLPKILEEILVGVAESVRGEISKLNYLGPLRTYPPRHVAFSEGNDPNWVAGGGAAWDLVKRDSSIRKRVNEWLGDEKKLSTHYEVKKRYLLTIESMRAKFAELAARATSIFYEEPDEKDSSWDPIGEVEAAVHEIPESLEKLEALFSDIHEIVLVDKRSNTPVSHRDVGIGISQVLPVLVTCFASTGKIIAMEQPEIHLHPALQAELGDVFIEAALGERKNTLIIETHSEHLILRILRRIRETAEGELPAGQIPLTPDDVQIIYAKPTSKGTTLHTIGISEDGEFMEKWPDGFFPERAKELF